MNADLLASVAAPVAFQATGQSMWGPGGPDIIDTGLLFSGIDWDVDLHPQLGDAASNLFIALDLATSGKIGVDFRAALDPGSVDAGFGGVANLEVIRGAGDMFSIHSQLAGSPTGSLATRSPNVDIESNFKFEVAASLGIRGEIGTPDITITVPSLTWVNQTISTIFGNITVPRPVFGTKQVTIPGITLAAFDTTLIDFDVAQTLSLLKLTNNPANPEFSILGIDLVESAPDGNLAVTFEIAFDPLAPPFFDVDVKDESDPKQKKEHSTNPFDVGVEFSMGDITLEAATLFLEDTTFSGAGALEASGSARLARIDLDADFLGSILLGIPPVFGASAGVSIAGFNIASFSYDILDVDIGPQFSVSQDFAFVPELWVAMQFDKPVVIGGVAKTQHSMPVGTSLDVLFDDADAGGTLGVQTSYFLKNQFTNTTNLQVAPFVDAVALAASFDTFLGTIFDAALFDFAPIVGPPVTLATIFNQTYELGGFGTVQGQTLNLVFNQPPVIEPEDLVLNSTTVSEGSPLTLTGSFTDADAGQTHSVVIDWGDSTPPTTVELGAGVHTFGPVEHIYADDHAVPRTITVTVTDPFDVSDNAAVEVVVLNVAPTLTLSGLAEVEEGALYTLKLASSDPGDDTITSWSINWGDGSTVQVVAGNPSAVTHIYADGTAPRTITATATDEDGTFDASALSITVTNVKPTVGFSGSSLNLDAGGQPIPFSGVRGQTLAFAGTISDPGFDNPAANSPTAETFTYVIEWGDGTGTGTLPAAVTRVGSAGIPTLAAFAASHVYANEGSYEVSVTVKDDDGGTTIVTETVTVAVIALQAGGDLAVGGTTGDDDIHFTPGGSVDVHLNGVALGAFHPTGRLIAFGQAGDDQIQVAGSIALSAWLYGDAGHDEIKGGAGDDVLLGGPGDDLIIGHSGRDLMIGGTGADRMVGNADDDILIAGFTAFDDNLAALAAIQAEWTSNHDLATRLANLSGQSEGNADRHNDAYFLKLGETVLDDGEEDKLTGSSGLDWFFFDTDLDRATDLNDEAFANDLEFILSS